MTPPTWPPGPKLTVDAVWIDHGRVLLVRRGRAPFRGRWALPGGYVEGDEGVEGTVLRELREETGLRGSSVRLIGVFSGPGRDPRGPTVTVAFRIGGRAGVPVGGDDARDAAWVPVRSLPALAFDHAEIVRAALRMGRTRRRSRR
ncbi:MAG: NUDIX hydrolase [Thermoplasmata archaeon]|nr:NUDIX hydrolase [Thermoplasmata archaeon]